MYCLHYNDSGEIVRTYLKGHDRTIKKPFVKLSEKEFEEYRANMAAYRVDGGKLVRTENREEEPAISDEEARRMEYVIQADPIQMMISGYKTEAEALRLNGDEKEAAECDEKARALLQEYLACKQKIRTRFGSIAD